MRRGFPSSPWFCIVWCWMSVGTVSCSQTPEPSAVAEASSPAKDTPKPTPVGAVATDTSPGLDLRPVPPNKRAEALQLLGETFCYCGCTRSVAACLAAGDKCACLECSTTMADFVVRTYAEGASTEEVEYELAEGFSKGWNGKPVTLPTKDQARKGSAKPKITISEFADFRCPHCAAAYPVMMEVLSKHKDVALQYYYFPLSHGGEASQLAAEAAEEARTQGKFWPMAELLFANQDQLDEPFLHRLAKDIGLNLDKFTLALKNRTHRKKVLANKKLGETSGILSTPSFFIDGRKFGMARSAENFSLRIAMEKARGTCR